MGEVRQTFDAALQHLLNDFQISISTHSGLYQTTPVGNQSKHIYLNAVCEVFTRLAPRELLKALHEVESRLGRVREVRWGARSIDLDLLSYSDQVIHETDLIIPHPGIVYRRFVLDPLVEANPDWLHPELRVSAAELVARLKLRPLEIQLADLPADEAQSIQQAIARSFPEVEIKRGVVETDKVICLRLTPESPPGKMTTIDLSRIPGTTLEQVESVLTAIFDNPTRISGW